MNDPGDGFNMASPEGATHVVAFSIVAQRAFHSMALAYMALRFMETHRTSASSPRFKLINICFAVTNNVVHGVMYFDEHFGPAFQVVLISALDDSVDCATVLEPDMPVLAWLPPRADSAAEAVVQHVREYLHYTL